MKIGNLEVVDVGELTKWGVTMAIYGAPGVGKTLRACEACLSEYGGKVLYIGNEGGERSITHLKGKVSVVKPKTWTQFQAVTNEILREDEKLGFGTIVIDNMSEIQTMNLNHQSGGAQPQIQHYGACSRDLIGTTRKYRDFAERAGINVIFIAWEDIEKDDLLGFVKRRVGFIPSIANSFPGMLDIVGYLTVESPKTTRNLSFAASNRTSAKFRRSKNEIAMSIPEELWFDIEKTPMVDILATLKGDIPFPKSQYVKRVPVQTTQNKEGE